MEGNRAAVIYMLRTAQQHHVQLSMMADQKASALIAACFVTLSITFTYVSSHDANLPLLVIMGFAILSALCAVLAVLPRVQTNPSIVGPRNLLFFGEFADLTLDEFVARTRPLLEDNEAVYSAMLRDIYCLGRVLMQRKYRFLKLAYSCFLVGLVAAPASALLELCWQRGWLL